MSALEGRLAQIVADRRATLEVERHLATGEAGPPARPFLSLLRGAPRPRVIAEIKRASPSAGVLHRGPWVPAEMARAYAGAGAAALSVLTEGRYFWGSLADLAEARAAVELPVLRKDFLLDPWQVGEARRAGADAVLLIAALLDGSLLEEMLEACRVSGVDALVEVHDLAEARRAVRAGARLVGVNHRDLRTFEIDLGRSGAIAPFLREAGCFVVAESGLRSAEDLRRLEAAGVDAFLVGSALVGSEDPGAALARLRGEGGP